MGFSGTLTAASAYPPLPTVADLVEKEVVKMDKITEVTILNGFDYNVDGKVYHFSYQLDDQSNFNTALTAATISLQLGNMTKEQLNTQYPGYVGSDGLLHPEKLPTALPEEWKMEWQGHADGKSWSLYFTPQQFLALANAAGMHNQTALAVGRITKGKLRGCQTEAELKAMVKSLDLDLKYRDARDTEDTWAAKKKV